MTKGTRSFRIIICILLGITMLWTALISYAFIYETKNERYGLFVAGVDVTNKNNHDILGDGTVFYNPDTCRLVLNNAVIQHDEQIIYSEIDLSIELIGENQFICNSEGSYTAIYASNHLLRKDLSIFGDGSLDILASHEADTSAIGIVADDVYIGAEVSITTGDATENVDGIYCNSLLLRNNANVSVNVGAAKSSIGVKVRDIMNLEKDTTLQVFTNPDATEQTTGVFVEGNIVLGGNSTLNVNGATASEDSLGIECIGTILAHEGASITAVSGGARGDILCYGSVVDLGAAIDGKIELVEGLSSTWPQEAGQ